jgi:6-phosphogluconolactonase (cycloisomerase 2 family)
MTLHKEILQSVSRRKVLKGAVTAVALPLPAVRADDKSDPKPGGNFVYIGTYTPNGLGIQLYTQNPSDGSLSFVKAVAMNPPVPNPSSLDIHPNGKWLYAVNEISNFNGGTDGSVTAFSINRTTGDLTLLNVKDSKGGGPAHISVDPKGAFVFVANYGGGSIAVLPINQADGSLLDASFSYKDSTSGLPLGKQPATSAPPGSFAISGHDAPHAHMMQADPTGTFVLHTDLGQDAIYVWSLDRNLGTLSQVQIVTVPSGDGPRHFSFHPNGKWLYSIQEEGSTLVLWYFDPKTGKLTKQQQVSTLPPNFVGTNYTSEVLVSRDGNFVYGANRLHDTIAVFEIDDDTGKVNRVSETWTRGDYPRNFAFDLRGNFLYAGNQRSDAVTIYNINKWSGGLSFTGHYVPVGSPSIIMFLK